MADRIYLDCNATQPCLPDAAALLAEVLAEGGNPSSVHAEGRRARQRIETARGQIAALVGLEARVGDAAQIVFTSGATEANALILKGFPGRPLLVSAIEHPAVLDNAGPQAVRIPVTADGIVDLAALDRLLADAAEPPLVAVMLANNETGVLQPIRAIADRVHARGGWLHCDAVQAPGRMPIAIDVLGADSLALSAHKLAGPQGVGALVLRQTGAGNLPRPLPQPLLRGGGQERGLRAGTENVAGIAAFGLAAERALHDLAYVVHQETLRDALADRLAAAGGVVIAAAAERLPNTLSIAMPGVPAALQVMSFDLEGFAVSAGAACSSGKVKQSHVLAAMGIAPDLAEATIRVSFGPRTPPDALDRFAETWELLFARKSRAA